MKNVVFTLFFALTCIIGYGQNRHIVDSLNQALRVAKEDTSKVRTLARLSSNYALNSADTSVMYAQESLSLAEKLKDEQGIALAQIQMCRALTTMGNYPLALEYGLNAQLYYEKVKDTIGLFNTALIHCFRELGDYDKALQNAFRNLHLIEVYYADKTHVNPPLASRSISTMQGFISSIYEKNNQLDSAIFYAQKVYENRKDWSGILYVLGNAHLKKGQYEKALHYFNLGMPFAVKNSFQKDVLEINNGIARVYKERGQLDSAVLTYKKVLNDKYGRVFPAGLLEASAQLAQIYETQHKTDSAFKYLKQTIALKDTLFNQGKTIGMQNLVFKNESTKKEIEAVRLTVQNRFKIYGLIVGLAILGLVALMLWRNNQQKQKANTLLSTQKEEITIQKSKVENTLTQLKSTQTQLIQSEKLASLGELTAGIAHEIQNPLNFVNNFSELSVDLVKDLKDEFKKPEKDEVYIDELFDDLSQNQEKINHHGKRASSIVKGMLEHSRASTGVKEWVDINKLADEYLRLSYHGMRTKDKDFNAELKTDFDESLPKIEVIPQDIGRVLLNLINNAFYAVNEKVKHLRSENFESFPNVGNSESYTPSVSVTTQHIDNQIIIKVTDNGIGMSEATKAKVFQPFFTTKPTGQGTGLGLSLAYDIVTKGHGGTLEVLSTEGVGTQMIICL